MDLYDRRTIDTRSTPLNSVDSLDTVLEEIDLPGKETDSACRSIGPESLRAQAAAIETILCESPTFYSDSDEGDLPSHDVLYDDDDSDVESYHGEQQQTADDAIHVGNIIHKRF